jgi:hypothetical protein
MLLIVACWILGIVDAYRIGMKMDLDLKGAGSQEGINGKKRLKVKG